MNNGLSDKSKAVAAILAFFLGTLGIHRFYLGKTGSAVAMLVLTILGWITSLFIIGLFIVLAVAIWGLVDFICILCGKMTDSQGRQLS